MLHPSFRSLALGLCLCSLYVGYELARACSLALFTSRSAGLSGACMACAGFVMSLATLALYGRGLELLGAKLTLTLSAAGCSVLFFSLAAGLSAYESGAVSWTLVGALFVFRETYVTLIGTQVWALLSAELKQRGPETSRIWFCLIQGVSCICSACAGMAAGRMATSWGQMYLLVATALSLALIAITVGLTSGGTLGGSGMERAGARNSKGGGFLRVLRSSASLFRRCPLLAALLAEAVVCQVLTATLNMSFNVAIRQSLGAQAPTDSGAQAAGFVGKSFAFVGLFSGCLQLIVMPWAMLRVDSSVLLRSLPLVAGCGFLATFISPGFRTATAAFAVVKILDYSVRGTALEMVYQPMPDQERLLGKEAIATVGVRIGRTAAHVTLYLCSALLGGDPPQRVLMVVALVAAVLWAVTLRRVEVLAQAHEWSQPDLQPHAPIAPTLKVGQGADDRSRSKLKIPATHGVCRNGGNDRGGASARRRAVRDSIEVVPIDSSPREIVDGHQSATGAREDKKKM